jgi:GTP-binding protein
MKPLEIVIVGRPNVGKSTLFNRLARRRLALVDKQPGLTRDRREAKAQIGSLDVKIVDTAGLEEAAEESLEARMRAQTEAAVAGGDIVLFVVDSRSGIVPVDEAFAELVRVSAKPVILVANKCEGRAGEAGFYDSYRLGLGEPIAISAEHGEGLSELYRAILAAAAEAGEAASNKPIEGTDKPLRIAIVGRPNAGKSTLLNAIVGEERVITGTEAGITRDSISVDVDWRSRSLLLHDTAGLRRKARVKGQAERLSVVSALDAIRFAEIVILLVDADIPFEKQDLQIAELIADEGRGIVIAVNKWDLVSDKKAKLKELVREAERLLPQIRGVPIIPISAAKGNGLNRMMNAAFAVYERWNKRVSTSALNRWLEDARERHPPPAMQGRRLKLRYMTQPNARPPTFVLFSSRPEKLPQAYQRYLVNGLRESFDFAGVPIRLNTRKGKNPYVS